MEDKLKARLTGAAILVALLVLVVPELFRGATNPPAQPAATPTPDNAAPLNSYQIDLQPGATAAASTADPDVATVDAREGGAGDAIAATSAPLPAGSGAVAAAKVKAAPAGAQKPAAAKSVAPPTSAVQSTGQSAAPVTGRGWSVRLGIFSKRENAQRLRQQAQAKGMAVTVSGPDGRGFYSVAGPKLAERGAAADWLQHAKGQGFAGVLTEAP